MLEREKIFMAPFFSRHNSSSAPQPHCWGMMQLRLDTLRQFRDEKLATSILGNKMIELYYEKSRAIIDMCKQSPAVKWFFKNTLERMIPVIEVML